MMEKVKYFRKCFIFSVISIVFLSFEGVDSEFIFTAVCPKVIRSNATFQLVLSAEHSNGPVHFDINLFFGNDSLIKNKKATIPDGNKSIAIPIDVKDAKLDLYNLTIIASSKLSHANDSVLVRIDHRLYSTLIQTNKQIFKPKDIVRFRVLFLNRLLKPVKTKNVKVFIYDAQRNEIKSWTNLESCKFGMITGNFTLSKEPVLGDWSVEVQTDVGGQNIKDEWELSEDLRTTQSFIVEEYILPRFKVEMKLSPSFVTYNDSVFNVELSSKYVYGKDVKGVCTVVLKPTYSFTISDKNSKKVSKTVHLDGNKHIEFNLKTEFNLTPEDATEYGVDFDLKASCSEETSSHVQNATAELKLYKYPYKISVVQEPEYLKPGFPLTMILKVSNQDDKPVIDYHEKALKVEHGFAYEAEDGVFFTRIPHTGLVTLTFNTSSNEYIRVTQFDVTYKQLTTSIPVPSKYSSSYKSYMQLSFSPDDTNPLKLGETIQIQVSVNRKFDSVTHVVMSRGMIISTGRVDWQESKKDHYLDLTLPLITPSPQVTVVVYTVLAPKNNIVVDSLKINLGLGSNSTDHKLLLSIENSKKGAQFEPGANLSIKCQGSPNSLVALRAVDQSVFLLKEDRDVTSQSVTELSQSFDQIMLRDRVWGGSGAFQTFELAGLHIMTNGFLKKNIYTVEYYASSFRGLHQMRNKKLGSAPIMMEDDMVSSPMVMGKAMMGPLVMAISHALTQAALSPRVRKAFPETWFFSEYENINGTFILPSTIPDTITSWAISGYEISPESGIGIADPTLTLTVFRPFFLFLDLPYSVVRGEVLALRVQLHHYMPKGMNATLTLDNAQREFEVLDGNDSLSRKVEMNASSVNIMVFLIRPLKMGTITLKLKAVSELAGDALSQPLLVKPPGVKQLKNNAILLNLVSSSRLETTIQTQFPENRVPDSDSVKVSITGNPLGGTIKNLDKLILLPRGCGEQNMMNFVPDIVVLDYLNATKALDKEPLKRATNFLEVGYQQELTYKRYDGSFAAFGMDEPAGSTWLTAFVAKSFMAARQYIHIDEGVIKEAIEFLIEKQNDDGRFVEEGRIHDSELLGEGTTKNDHSMTAYVLMTIYEATKAEKEGERLKAILNHGVSWLLSENPLGSGNSTKDLYSITLITYLLHLINHPNKDKYYEGMSQLSKYDSTEDFLYWENTANVNGDTEVTGAKPYDYYFPWNYSLKPASVEITAYALLITLMREGSGGLVRSVSIARWLMKQRNEAGGFLSTQDTVVGLQALGKFAELTSTTNYGIKVKLTWDIQNVKNDSTSANSTADSSDLGRFEFNIGKDNATTLQEYFLPETVRQVNVTAEGAGTAMAQLSWSYFMNNEGKSSGFSLDVQVEGKDKNRRLKYKICSSYSNKGKDTNMAILEVNTPTGYKFDLTELISLKSIPKVQRYELDERDSKLNIYLSSLSATQICLNVNAYRAYLVAEHSKPSVTVYDYYDTTRKAQQTYKVPKIDVCDICALEDTCRMKNCIEGTTTT